MIVLLIVSHSNRSITLSPDSIIIIKNASESDYFELANEDLKLEFDGECLYIHSPATKRHEKLVYKLLKYFEKYFELHPDLGEALGSRFALRLPTGKRPEPDIVVVPVDTVKETDSIFKGIPLLLIEILSPTTRDHDLYNKREWYMDAFVPEIWYIDLEEKKVITVRKEHSDEYIVQENVKGKVESQILPGFEIEIEELF